MNRTFIFVLLATLPALAQFGQGGIGAGGGTTVIVSDSANFTNFVTFDSGIAVSDTVYIGSRSLGANTGYLTTANSRLKIVYGQATGGFRWQGSSGTIMGSLLTDGVVHQFGSEASLPIHFSTGYILGTSLRPAFAFSTTSDITATSGKSILLKIGETGYAAGGDFAPTSGTAGYEAVRVDPTINQTGSASGNVDVLVVRPTATSVLGTMNLIMAGTAADTAKFLVSANGIVRKVEERELPASAFLSPAAGGASKDTIGVVPCLVFATDADDSSYYDFVLPANFSSLDSIQVETMVTTPGDDSLSYAVSVAGVAVGEDVTDPSFGTAVADTIDLGATDNLVFRMSFVGPFSGLAGNDICFVKLRRDVSIANDVEQNSFVTRVRAFGKGIK